jgi:protocatechuate 3,4-dioxygenase alpha subunit
VVWGPAARGARDTITGRVLDGDGQPVNDAVLEIWQADADGHFAHPEDERSAAPGLEGFGRIPTTSDGRFRFTTVVPGSVPGPSGRLQAPHLLVAVSMRGLLRHLFTRVYFPDHPANHDDPVLSLVEPSRRATLIARRGELEPDVLEWNVRLQGDRETVFFDG